MKYYTGIGSRETPKDILFLMAQIGYFLAKKGYILRSGHAKGADSAFELGALLHNKISNHSTELEIYLPDSTFNYAHKSKNQSRFKIINNNNAYKLAASIHPKWDNCNHYAKKLHARNCYQVLGDNLSIKSKFVIFYAIPISKNKFKGGTNTAVQLALLNNIPVFNLYNENIKNNILGILLDLL